MLYYSVVFFTLVMLSNQLSIGKYILLFCIFTHLIILFNMYKKKSDVFGKVTSLLFILFFILNIYEYHYFRYFSVAYGILGLLATFLFITGSENIKQSDEDLVPTEKMVIEDLIILETYEKENVKIYKMIVIDKSNNIDLLIDAYVKAFKELKIKSDLDKENNIKTILIS